MATSERIDVERFLPARPARPPATGVVGAAPVKASQAVRLAPGVWRVSIVSVDIPFLGMIWLSVKVFLAMIIAGFLIWVVGNTIYVGGIILLSHVIGR